MHYNIALGAEKYFYFYFKKLSIAGMRMGRGYSNLSGTGMEVDFSSPLGMSMVMDKYIGVGYGDEEGKTRPHPSPLSCIVAIKI